MDPPHFKLAVGGYLPREVVTPGKLSGVLLARSCQGVLSDRSCLLLWWPLGHWTRGLFVCSFLVSFLYGAFFYLAPFHSSKPLVEIDCRDVIPEFILGVKATLLTPPILCPNPSLPPVSFISPIASPIFLGRIFHCDWVGLPAVGGPLRVCRSPRVS